MMHRWAWLACAALAIASPAAAEGPQRAQDMTWREFEASAANGAVALWALGVLEAHGPHLPLGTDIRIPEAQIDRMGAGLAAHGVNSVALPAYGWGVNHVTGAFPGSIHVRPEIMSGLMVDVFRSLERAGFREVYCITGHYDAAHSRAIIQAVRDVNRSGAISVYFVVPEGLGRRLGVAADDPHVLLARTPPEAAREHPDLHGGAGETSAMLHLAPDSVRPAARALPPTDLSPAEVAAWRGGGEAARRITPEAYLGAPAEASAAQGARKVNGEADAYVEAILAAHTRQAAQR